jgi:hypothetical protein
VENIVSRIPVDKTARLVTGEGVSYEPDCQLKQNLHNKNIIAVDKERTKRSPHKLLVGTKKGRLTVLGIMLTGNRKKKAVWVVRCSCGSYEVRKLKTLNKSKQDDSCLECKNLDYLKRRSKHLGGYK